MVVEAVSRLLGENRRGPDPFRKGASVAGQIDAVLAALAQQMASELRAELPLWVRVKLLGRYRDGRRNVVRWFLRGFNERPAPVLEGAGFLLGWRRVRYPIDFIEIGAGLLRPDGIPEIQEGDWTWALWPIVEVWQDPGGPHDAEDIEFFMEAYGRVLTARGFEPTRERLQELTGRLLLDGELSPLIPRSAKQPSL